MWSDLHYHETRIDFEKGLLLAVGADNAKGTNESKFDVRLLGLGLYWAWLFVTFYTSVLFPFNEAAADSARDAWSWAAWAHALTLVMCALLGKRLEKFAENKGLIVVMAICCFVGTALVPFSQWLVAGAVSWILTATGAVSTGCATAWLVLLYGRQFASMESGAALKAIGFAYLLSCILYFFVRLFDPWVAIATVLVLPAASSLILLSYGNRDLNTAEGSANLPSLRVNVRVVIPLVTLFLFALSGELFRGFAVPAGVQADLSGMGDLYMIGGTVGLILLVGVVLAQRYLGGGADAVPNMQAVLVIMALSFLCTVLFGTSYALAYAVFGAAFMCCRCIVWAYCAIVARRTTASSFSVFGTVQASFALAVVVGVPLAQRLSTAVDAGVVSWDAIAASFLFLIVVIAVVVTKQSDFESAWGLVPRARMLAQEKGPSAGSDSASIDSRAEGSDADEPLAFLTERYGLTPRELDVALLLARGRSLPFIQKELHISQGTAQSHLTHIYRKMSVHSRQEFIDAIDDEMPVQSL